jgi:hypothetical protein
MSKAGELVGQGSGLFINSPLTRGRGGGTAPQQKEGLGVSPPEIYLKQYTNLRILGHFEKKKYVKRSFLHEKQSKTSHLRTKKQDFCLKFKPPLPIGGC